MQQLDLLDHHYKYLKLLALLSNNESDVTSVTDYELQLDKNGQDNFVFNWDGWKPMSEYNAEYLFKKRQLKFPFYHNKQLTSEAFRGVYENNHQPDRFTVSP